MKQNITLAVASYNRRDYLECLSASLSASVELDRINLRVYDDCSSLLSVDDIRQIIPYAKEIKRRASNLRADGNMFQIFQDFLTTEDDYLLLCDSDLIFRPGWLDMLFEYMPKTDGILSLYNSRMHSPSPILDNSEHNQFLLTKNDLGAAGCAFTRERVKELVKAFPTLPTHTTFDWIWSEFFLSRRLNLYCLQESYIQHIGIIGQNNFGLLTHYDYGLSFLPESEINQRIMIKFIDGLVQAQEQWEQRHGLCNLMKTIPYDRQLGERRASPWSNTDKISWGHYFLVSTRRLLLKLLQKLSF